MPILPGKKNMATAIIVGEGEVRLVKQQQTDLTVKTRGRGMVDISREISNLLAAMDIRTSILNLFVQHTSCSLLIQENADPSVQDDLERFFARLVPDGDAIFCHRMEGPDDMPAHIRAALTATSLSIPVRSGRMQLGAWQGIFLYEHRLKPHLRRVIMHVAGD